MSAERAPQPHTALTEDTVQLPVYVQAAGTPASVPAEASVSGIAPHSGSADPGIGGIAAPPKGPEAPEPVKELEPPPREFRVGSPDRHEIPHPFIRGRRWGDIRLSAKTLRSILTGSTPPALGADSGVLTPADRGILSEEIITRPPDRDRPHKPTGPTMLAKLIAVAENMETQQVEAPVGTAAFEELLRTVSEVGKDPNIRGYITSPYGGPEPRHLGGIVQVAQIVGRMRDGRDPSPVHDLSAVNRLWHDIQAASYNPTLRAVPEVQQIIGAFSEFIGQMQYLDAYTRQEQQKYNEAHGIEEEPTGLDLNGHMLDIMNANKPGGMRPVGSHVRQVEIPSYLYEICESIKGNTDEILLKEAEAERKYAGSKTPKMHRDHSRDRSHSRVTGHEASHNIDIHKIEDMKAGAWPEHQVIRRLWRALEVEPRVARLLTRDPQASAALERLLYGIAYNRLGGTVRVARPPREHDPMDPDYVPPSDYTEDVPAYNGVPPWASYAPIPRGRRAHSKTALVPPVSAPPSGSRAPDPLWNAPTEATPIPYAVPPSEAIVPPALKSRPRRRIGSLAASAAGVISHLNPRGWRRRGKGGAHAPDPHDPSSP